MTLMRLPTPPPPGEFLAPKLRSLFFRPGPNGQAIYIPSRYKSARGGRASAKSWGLSGLATVLGAQRPLRFLCVREVQSSIRESIHKLLSNRIDALGLAPYYDILREVIVAKQRLTKTRDKRTEFVFAGVKTDPAKIKGFEDPDVCLVEEAENFAESSWRQLTPTIRNRTGTSEIWVSFNPRRKEDPTSVRFIERPNAFTRSIVMNWSDNPWFPADAAIERQAALDLIAHARDDNERAQYQADYDHVWEGYYERQTMSAVIRRWTVDEFDDPHPDAGIRIRYGVDWGFSNDPLAMVRFWITSGTDERGDFKELWISHEAFGHHVELNDTPRFFESVPGSRFWPIKADCSAPATISHVRSLGFNIEGAEKWPGSVEDGIRHLNSYRMIHIHPRCEHMRREARLYSYKVDTKVEPPQVLPIILDANNHGWDAVRYGLDGEIQRGGSMGTWLKLGTQ